MQPEYWVCIAQDSSIPVSPLFFVHCNTQYIFLLQPLIPRTCSKQRHNKAPILTTRRSFPLLNCHSSCPSVTCFEKSVLLWAGVSMPSSDMPIPDRNEMSYDKGSRQLSQLLYLRHSLHLWEKDVCRLRNLRSRHCTLHSIWIPLCL